VKREDQLPDLAQRLSRQTAPHSIKERRILAVHLPEFAIERWQIWCARHASTLPEELPVALAVDTAHGPVVHATNRAAAIAGVRRHARIVDMRALCPELKVEYADTVGDEKLLENLTFWSRQWGPWSVADAPDGLFCDTSGVAHLHGGEDRLLRNVEERFSKIGFQTQLALASTPGAAWALAHYGPVRSIATSANLMRMLAPLPVAALRLSPKTVTTLQRLGLKTIGALADVPRIALARRFRDHADPSDTPLHRLDLTLGRQADPLNAQADPIRFVTTENLTEPALDPAPYLPDLCQKLCVQLARSQHGVRRLRLSAYRTDGMVATSFLTTAQPSNNPEHLHSLLLGKLDHIDPGFGFDVLTLTAESTENLDIVQTRLDGNPDDGTEFARLIDRLAARFGPNKLQRVALSGSHIPERAANWHPAPQRYASPLPSTQRRPIRIFAPPEEIRVLYAVPEGPPAKFIWRRVTHRVIRFAGPERVAPEWWHDRPGTRLRDYYHIETETGRRLWIYRNGLHGDGRGGEPSWFLHGVFA